MESFVGLEIDYRLTGCGRAGRAIDCQALTIGVDTLDSSVEIRDRYSVHTYIATVGSLGLNVRHAYSRDSILSLPVSALR